MVRFVELYSTGDTTSRRTFEVNPAAISYLVDMAQQNQTRIRFNSGDIITVAGSLADVLQALGVEM